MPNSRRLWQGTGFHTDTPWGLRVRASELGLDSLLLQYRAMLRIRRFDQGRLPGLFREMRPLNLQPQPCTDLLRPDLHSWAGAVNLVYQRGWTPAERAKEHDIQFVKDQIRAITSPLQLVALTEILAQADKRLLPRVSAAADSVLARVRGDWFSFQYTSGRIGLGRSNAAAFRDYLVAHLRDVQCGPRWPFRKPEEPEHVTRFNQFAADHPDLNLQPIDTKALNLSRVDESAKLDEFWTSDKSKPLQEDLRWLTHGNRKLPDKERFWTLDERRSVEWNEKYIDFLKRVDNWRAADESSPRAWFFMRSRIWLSLVKLVPPGPQRTNSFRSTIAWLNSSYADGAVSRAEWWIFAKELLDLAGTDPQMLTNVEQFGSPVLSVHAHLNNLK